MTLKKKKKKKNFFKNRKINNTDLDKNPRVGGTPAKDKKIKIIENTKNEFTLMLLKSFKVFRNLESNIKIKEKKIKFIKI